MLDGVNIVADGSRAKSTTPDLAVMLLYSVSLECQATPLWEQDALLKSVGYKASVSLRSLYTHDL